MTFLLGAQILSVVGLAVLFLLFKKAMPSYLAEKGKNLATKEDIGEITEEVERVKAAVNESAEEFKASLSKQLHRFSTQFTRLDQQRATGIMQIHGLMCDIERSLIWQSGPASTAIVSTAPEERTTKALNKAWEDIVRLNHILNYHSLLITESTCRRVYDWSGEAMTVVSAIGNEIEPLRRQAASSKLSLREREAALIRITDGHLKPALPQLALVRRELEVEFRTLLGVGRDGRAL